MMQTPEIKKLGSYLIDAGLVTIAQIDVALSDQAFMDDMRIGDILVTRGWIKQQTLDFVINKVVDPEQSIARRTTLEDAPVMRQKLRDTSPVGQPIEASVGHSTRLPQPSPKTITEGRSATFAQARSLDGSRVIEILKPQRTYTVGDITTPSDPGCVNDRKPLASVSRDDDDMNWAG